MQSGPGSNSKKSSKDDKTLIIRIFALDVDLQYVKRKLEAGNALNRNMIICINISRFVR